MRIVFIIVTLLLAFFIYRNTGVRRFIYFLAGLCFVSMNVVVIPGTPLTSHNIFMVAYVISLLRHNELKKELKAFPFLGIFVVLLVVNLCIGFFDNRLDIVSKIIRSIVNFLNTVFCLFVGYTSIKSLKDWNEILSKSIWIFVLMGCYGLFTWVLQSNPIYDSVNASFNAVEMWADVQERGYRVLSTMNNPIAYGAVMGMATLYLFANQQNIKRRVFWIVFFLLLLNVLFTYSRSAIAGMLIGFVVFAFLKYRISIKLFVLFIVCSFLVLIAYATIPSIQHVVDLMADVVLTGGQNAQGSNIELKDLQLEVSIFYFLQSPFWGNGFRFFQEELVSGNIASYDGSLAGLEGYLFAILVENGIFMLIAMVTFFIQLLYFTLKRARYNEVACFSASLIVFFMFFIYITGTYGNVFLYFMSFIGLSIKYLQLYDVLYFNSRLQRRKLY